MKFENTVRVISERMKIAASIASAMQHARLQRDYATATSLLSILQEMPVRGTMAWSAPNTGYDGASTRL
jgi:hypothetical protein